MRAAFEAGDEALVLKMFSRRRCREQSTGRKTGSDLDLCSALGGTRTPNLLIRSQMLSPIELRAPVAEKQGYRGAEAAPNRRRSYPLVPRPAHTQGVVGVPYNQTGLLVHDADAHIMETPNWLRDHADPGIRDRIQPLRYPSGNELRQTGDPSEQQRDLVAAFERLAGQAPVRRVPQQRGRRHHGPQELCRHR